MKSENVNSLADFKKWCEVRGYEAWTQGRGFWFARNDAGASPYVYSVDFNTLETTVLRHY